jgi:hypothetical protein
MITDALGKEIEIGKLYGVAVSNNGLSRITLGKAVKTTEKGNVTLEVVKEGIGIDNTVKNYGGKKTPKIWTKCYHLFPVNCEHPDDSVTEGERVPAVYGSWATLDCAICGGWRYKDYHTYPLWHYEEKDLTERDDD